ncbi:glutamate--tRNA ligase [Candidatus Acetothermia bacterium]|nr:glutamate--tRNA ligase [Candidatus Acetothermia bacterium]MBI3644110.1 glutamate--tRNA ligase [Candidatus Acetothermia bacterium]
MSDKKSTTRPRVRFAPSPSGELHVGGARTALFNWLFARHHGGAFILRFEDTDTDRNKPELIEPIMESLRWLGLDLDEGPYFQSQRTSIYQEHAKKLLAEGKAYLCYCTPEEIEEKRKMAQVTKQNFRYDGKCRNLTPDERSQFEREGRKGALRIKIDPHGSTVVRDLIRGDVVYAHAELDDFVIQRSDGLPLYNFAVVVDDVTMGITHVIRADEHINNTPKQLLIYSALGFDYTKVKFVHVPMVLAKDRTKLSKRHGATAVFEYLEKGVLPEALVNYLVRLGWSHGDQEIFSMEEMIQKFSLEAVHPSPAIFDEEKLLWLNHHYIMHGDPMRLGELAKQFAIKKGIYSEQEANAISADRWAAVVNFLKERNRTLVELAESSKPFLKDQLEYYDPKAIEKFLTPDKAKLLEHVIEAVKENIDNVSFTATNLDAAVRAKLEANGSSLKEVAQPCRVALSGLTQGPGLFEMMEFLGKKRVIERLEKAISMNINKK